MKRMVSDPLPHIAAAVAGTLRLGAALSTLARDGTSAAAVGAMRDEDPAGALRRANAYWPGISDKTPAALE